jgi:glucose-6-phosphate isomerase
MRIDPDWQAISTEAARLIDSPLSALIAADPGRTSAFSLRVGPLHANFARQRLDASARAALLGLARKADVAGAIRALFDGEPVNASERRPALHTALRSDLGQGDVARAAHADALVVQARMSALAAALRDTDVTDVINIGIGGSDLGPRLAVDALRDFGDGRFRCHFLGNVDASAVQHLLASLDPARTAVLLVSKSFGTQETLLNGGIVRAWLGNDERVFGITANVDKAKAFGIDAERILPMWDWVGGRYSLWSAVGFVVQLTIGDENFSRLLAGAALMDAHVASTAMEDNLAVWHALAMVWNRNGLGLDTHAVLPYDERLAMLPAYLQQLVMESLGKSVRPDGSRPPVATVPTLWGGAGTSSQHSFFQALHQGTDTVPSDFIGVVRPAHSFAESHEALLAHLLAQMEALANGFVDPDPQKSYPGNRPSTLLLLDELTPASFGALIALYEHSVYVQSVIWGINAFDQWGVELGKKIAGRLQPAVAGTPGADAAVTDPVTRAMLAEIRSRR